MQIRDYWVVISKRWWLLVLAALVAGASAYGISKVQQPIYRSTAFLVVTPARTDYGLTLVIQNLLRQYSRTVQTSELAQKVNRSLELDLSPEKLQQEVTVSSVPEDFLLQIDVDDPDPGRAQAIARALAQAFVEDQQVRMAPIEPRDRVLVELLEDPKPGELDRPRTRVNVIAGVVLGLVLGGIVAFALEYLDDTIKSVEDVERYVALPAVGSIPRISPSDSRLLSPRPVQAAGKQAG